MESLSTTRILATSGALEELDRHAGAGAEVGPGVGPGQREAVDRDAPGGGSAVLGAAVDDVGAEEGGAPRRQERGDAGLAAGLIAVLAQHRGRIEVPPPAAARIEDQRPVVGRRIIDRHDGLNVAAAPVDVAPLGSAVAAVLAVLVGLELQAVVGVLGVELVEDLNRRGGAEELADDRCEPRVAAAGEERRLAPSRPDDPLQPARPVRAAEDELAAGVLDFLLARLFRRIVAARGQRLGKLEPYPPQPFRGLGHRRHLFTGEEVFEDQKALVVEPANVRRRQLTDHKWWDSNRYGESTRRMEASARHPRLWKTFCTSSSCSSRSSRVSTSVA